MKYTMPVDGFKKIMVALLFLLCLFVIKNAAFAQTVDFDASPTEGMAPLPVVFTDQSTYPSSFRRAWSCPGGIPESVDGTEVAVLYYTPGSYDVTLTIWDGPYFKDSTTKHGYITVYEPDMDWGDAPDDVALDYRTLATSNGARHLVDYRVFLGDAVDTEVDGLQGSLAIDGIPHGNA